MPSHALTLTHSRTCASQGPYSNGTGHLNASVFAWATSQLPLFEASDADIEQAYYFRAKTYHSHMNPTAYVDQPVIVSENFASSNPVAVNA